MFEPRLYVARPRDPRDDITSVLENICIASPRLSLKLI